MKKYIVVGLIVLVGGALLLGPLLNTKEVTGDKKLSKKVQFGFKESLALKFNHKVTLDIINNNASEIVLIYGGKEVKRWSAPKEDTLYYSIIGGELGTKEIILQAKLEDGTIQTDRRFIRVISDVIPKQMKVESLNAFRHDPTSFTQGLEFYKGRLFEGTGDPGGEGSSFVAEVELKTGKHLQKLSLQAGYFGEGITILNDTLYQITWKNGKCFLYDVKDQIQMLQKEFSYNGEGWGLCNNENYLIMSDGTERITFRKPETFEIVKTINVYNDRGPVNYLNELEFFNGKIYANVWTTDIIISIDPETGRVLEQIDVSELVSTARGMGEVLNGITYNKQTNKIYLTGKYWDRLYEVRIVEK